VTVTLKNSALDTLVFINDFVKGLLTGFVVF
jgi:hypothetical protein